MDKQEFIEQMLEFVGSHWADFKSFCSEKGYDELNVQKAYEEFYEEMYGS